MDRYRATVAQAPKWTATRIPHRPPMFATVATPCATGHVLEAEQQVPMSQVPSAARAAIEKGAAGGRVVRVEKVTSPGSSELAYEARIKLHGKY